MERKSGFVNPIFVDQPIVKDSNRKSYVGLPPPPPVVEKVEGQTYRKYWADYTAQEAEKFIGRQNIPYYKATLDLGKKFVQCSPFDFDDEEDHYRPVCWRQKAPIPHCQTVHAAKDGFENIIRPLHAFAYANVSSADGSHLDVSEEIVAAFADLMQKDFTPTFDTRLEGAAKRSTMGATLCALNRSMFEKTLEAPPRLETLLWGAGNGTNDLYRIWISFCENRNQVTDLFADSYDPHFAMAEGCRNLQSVHGLPHRFIHGKDYHLQDADFPSNKYHLVTTMNSAQYLMERIGDSYYNIKALARALKDNGRLVGNYFDARQIATIRGCTMKPPHFYDPSTHIKLMEVSLDLYGDRKQFIHAFGKTYEEPYFEPHELEYACYTSGLDCVVYNSSSVAVFTPLESRYNFHLLPDVPENIASNVVVVTKRAVLRTWDFSASVGTMGDISLYKSDHGESSNTLLVGPRPLCAGDIFDLMNGGVYLMCDKSDGFPASCVMTGEFLYVTTKLGKYRLGPFRDIGVLNFQCELVNGRLQFVQLMYENGNPYTYGYGATRAYALRNDATTCFAALDFKLLSFVPLSEQQYVEGFLVINYLSPPPPLRSNMSGSKKPTDLYYTGQWYCKRRYTIDLHVSQFKMIGNNMVFSHLGHHFELPADSIKYSAVTEWYIDTCELKQYRLDKVKGNPADQIHNAFFSLKPRSVNKKLKINMDRFSFRPLTHWDDDTVVNFSSKNIEDYTVKELFLLAVSYPRGLKFISDDDAREKVRMMRNKLYKSPLLSTLYDVGYDSAPVLKKIPAHYIG